jgi:hypothetical protein
MILGIKDFKESIFSVRMGDNIYRVKRLLGDPDESDKNQLIYYNHQGNYLNFYLDKKRKCISGFFIRPGLSKEEVENKKKTMATMVETGAIPSHEERRSNLLKKVAAKRVAEREYKKDQRNAQMAAMGNPSISGSLKEKNTVLNPVENSPYLDGKQERYLFPFGQWSRWGYIDQTGKYLIKPRFSQAKRFSEGLAGVQLDQKWGYIDATGKMVIEPAFDYVSKFSEEIAAVCLEGKWGYINKKGNLLVIPQFSGAEDLHEGRAAINIGGQQKRWWVTGGKWGFIDTEGNTIVEPQYDLVGKFSDGVARVKKDNKWNYIDKSGELSIKGQYAIAGDFSEGLANVGWFEGLRAYINTSGEFAIKPRFKLSMKFFEGLARIKIDGKWGYIDKKGTIAIEPQFAAAKKFSEGLAAVKIGDKWGYIDQAGNKVIPARYDSTSSFFNGLAHVWEKASGEAYIDKMGAVITNYQKLQQVISSSREKETGHAPNTTLD